MIIVSLYLLIGLIVVVLIGNYEQVSWQDFVDGALSMCMGAIVVMIFWPLVLLWIWANSNR